MIRRNTTRTVLSSVEYTHLTDTPNADTLSFALTTSSEFYIGFKHKFASRYFALSTLNTNPSTITVKYWDGSAWTAVSDLIDQTRGFTKSGFISWNNEDDWTAKNISPITDENEEQYWLQITVSANLSAGTALQGVLNLFCDDEIMAQYYPEIINDTRWLPDGQTNFLSQYVAAKDLIVTRLKARKSIIEEAEILDVNEVAIAAVHAAAKIIMFPIEEDPKTQTKEAEAEMNNFINLVPIRTDIDKSGKIDDAEKKAEGIYFRAR